MKRGFSLVEVLLAVSIFALLITGIAGALIFGQDSTRIFGETARATFLAEEGLEATRNIRDDKFTNLTDGTFGLVISGGVWTFSGSSDTTGIFTRSIAISTIDTKRKRVVSTVTWQQNQQRPGSVVLTTNLDKWRQ